jgi:hypothetical protein
MKRIIVLIVIHSALVLGLSAQTNEFSYQGFITDNNAPANGLYDIEFRVFAALSGGPVLATETRPGVAVTNGVFSVTLDFGVFPPLDRYLELGVRPAGGGVFTTLTPRSKILAVPHSTLAKNALLLGGVGAGQFVQTNDARLSDARNPLPNSANYIQNRTTQQSASNFNISGDGTVGGKLIGDIVQATTQYNLGNNRVLAKVGVNNLFLGTLAGSADGGIQNTLLGDSAGRDNTGNENTLVGFVTGQFSTGNNNSFVGSRAGRANTTGNSNTLLGYSAEVGAGALTNATAIGANAFVEQSNSLVLGSVSGLNGATSMTDVGIGVTTPARRLDVNGIVRVGATGGTIGCVEDRDGTVIAGTCASDLRFKRDVKPFGTILGNFAKLKPVTYFWRADEFSDQHFGRRQSFGLIAQDVEKLFPDLVTVDEKGYKAVNYSKLPLYTVQAVTELKLENDSLRARLEQQQSEIDELKRLVRSIKLVRKSARGRRQNENK